jgi:hypothetical protein
MQAFRPRLLWPAFFVALGAAQPLHAQTVTGEIVAADDERPLAGAFVSLVGADGRRHAGYVTDRDGRYTLRARASGTYTLQVERIGFETVTSGPLEIGNDTVRYRFVVPVRAVVLPALVVQTPNRCGRSDSTPAVHALWSEIRKALDLTAWTQQSAGIRYTLVQQQRETTPAGSHLLYERRIPRSVTTALPYVAVTAAELAQDGFFRRRHEQALLLGIDAEALLSADFLEVYCFRLVQGADGEVGLGFEPQQRRSVTDIRGVLWVDAASAHLRRLEYAYVNLPGDLSGRNAGGSVHFAPLADGTWIISQWTIYSPILSRPATARVTVASGWREDGGVVVAAERDGETIYVLDGGGVIEGRYTERYSRAASAGTVVHLSGTPFVGVADEAGDFRIEGIPPGRYAIAFTPAWFEDLRIPVALDSITVPADRPVRHDITGIAESRALHGLCPGERDTPGLRPGVIHGFVGHAETGRPRAYTPLFVQYRVDRVTYSKTVYTSSEGRYVVCFVPQRSVVQIRLVDGDEDEAVRLVLRGPFLRHDFF